MYIIYKTIIIFLFYFIYFYNVIYIYKQTKVYFIYTNFNKNCAIDI